MKKLLSMFLVASMLTGMLSAGAVEVPDNSGETAQTMAATQVASGTCGENVTWVLTEDGTLTISGEGAMDNYQRYGAPWNAHNRKIVSVVVENGVTSIGNNAFAYYNFLASVTLSATVETIGEDALTGCQKLEAITVEDGSEHFSSVDGVLFDGATTKLVIYPNGSQRTEYTVPDGVTAIGAYAFYNQDKIVAITLPDSVTVLEPFAFANCDKLTSVNIPDGVTKFAEHLFFNSYSLESINIPNGVTAIEEYAFSSCSALESVTIPASVESIGYRAFEGCVSIKSFTVDEDNAYFSSVDGVLFDKAVSTLIVYPAANERTSYEIPSTVTRIETYAIAGCKYLEHLVIPGSVAYVGGRIVSDCTALKTITVDEGNTLYCSVDGVLFDKAMTTLHCHPAASDRTSYTVPDGVTTISDSAFLGGVNLVSIILPESVTSIQSNGFSGCTALKNIVFPAGVTQLSYCVFYGCSALENFEIPASVTVVGDWAFRECTSLKNITIPDGVTAIGMDAFYAAGLESIVIPVSVTQIKYMAFYQCSALTKVYYAGTQAQWNAITIDSYNDPLKNAEIIYNSTGIPVELPEGAIDGGTFAGNLIWVLSEDGTLTISGTGAMEDYDMYDLFLGSDERPWEDYVESTITSVVINDGVTSVGAVAFYGCTGLTSVTIPNSVTSIGNYAFSDCTGLTSITIPASVTSISGGAFSSCTSLTEIVVGEDSDDFCTVDGILFNKNMTALRCYPAGKTNRTYAIPDSVTSISGNAFSGCTGLKRITIPDSVTRIRDYAFSGCTGLTRITIPDSVTSIGVSAFSSCTGLTSIAIPVSVIFIDFYAFYNCNALVAIYYGGSEEQWSALGMSEGNDYPLNAEIIYNAEMPELVNLGDVNCDGEVNLGDVQLLFMFTRDKAELTADGLAASDVNNDGTINLGDVQLLFMFTRGKAELG